MNTLASLLGFVVYVLQLLIYVIIAQVILSWLVAFNVINTQNRFVYSVLDGLERLLGPIYRPIRSRMPDLGGLDFTPVIVILAIILAQQLLQGLARDLMIP
ncbi:MAG: YggT family protein [Sphingomonadaceae bacterium]